MISQEGHHILTLKDINLKSKSVFLRLDLNVPLDGEIILDEMRIQSSLSTIKYIMDQGGKVVIGSHLGRPTQDRKQSLLPVADRLGELLGVEVIFMDSPLTEAPKVLVNTLTEGQIIVLENLRFHDGEMQNTDELAKTLRKYTSVYVNDAFGVCHREHASVHKVPQFYQEKALGFLIEKELEALNFVLNSPKSPFVMILGGAKVDDKMGLIQSLINRVDTLIIVGAMAYPFLKAKGFSVGDSLCSDQQVFFAKKLIHIFERTNLDVIFPVDHKVVEDVCHPEHLLEVSKIEKRFKGVDIGAKTVQLCEEVISNAGTIFWNGPAGLFEQEEYAQGSFSLARAVSESQAQAIVGGGDTASMVNKSGFSEGLFHVSTGGGASLAYLEGKMLPGLQALELTKVELQKQKTVFVSTGDDEDE